MAKAKSGLPARRTPLPPALVSASASQVEAAIGGRAALIAGLAYAPKSRDLTYVLGLIGDPEHARTPLAELCAIGGITVGELLDAYKSGELNRAQAIGTSIIGAGLPDVVADTFRLAKPYADTCSYCQGVGQTTAEPTKDVPNPEPQTCHACQGQGQLTYPGDLEHKKLALDLGKVLSKGGPQVAVQVNQSVGVHLGVAGGALEAMQAVTDRLLYSDEVVEGAVVEEPAAPVAEAALDEDWRGGVSGEEPSA